MSVFSGTTMAFFGIMPLFKGTAAAFGTQCCCPGIGAGFLYVAVGDGVKWFKPFGRFADFDAAGNVITAISSLGNGAVSRITPNGNETVLLSLSPASQINDMDADDAGNAYIATNGATSKVLSTGGTAWSRVETLNHLHYSDSRVKVFVPASDGFAVWNATTGTTEQFVDMGFGFITAGIVTDADGDVYVCGSDSNGSAIHKFIGAGTTATWTTSTASDYQPPLRFDDVNDVLFCVSNSDGTVHKIDPATGTGASVPYISNYGAVTDIDSDASGRLFVNSTSFSGTNYAVIRYDGTSAVWGYKPSAFFDFSGPFAADSTGTAIGISTFFDHGKTSAPFF